ncbi:MAG: hypothetical protein B7X08_03290 [Acidocella sp. 20-63-7]|nr:MAG: hypothetical protein B7X08_03290 [Acidocella sp. 20-63-7]HQT45756.1 hypothetical protein [Acidocella sp.]
MSAIARKAALGTSMAAVTLCITLAALGFFIASFYILLTQHTSSAAAAAITGAILLALALITGLITKTIFKKRSQNLSDWSELLSLATYLIRRDPKKAMLLALLAGAVTEYFAGDKPQR